MSLEWNNEQPIWRQLRERVSAMILDGVLAEGEAAPSVRSAAADNRLNPLTVMKAYQSLADEGVLEKRRGLGLFVAPGAREALLRDERARFLAEQWPAILATIRRLGLKPQELLADVGGEG